MKTVLTSLIMAMAASGVSAKTIDMVDARTGEAAGTVVIENTEYGLVLTPSLTGLQPGGHGFHIHENPSCASAVKNGNTVPAGAAGSHYDPHGTDNHGYPWSDAAHLGDLPLLYVNGEGDARHPVLAPRLTVDKVTGRALMVHEEGDNYADEPAKLGGGGPRVLCGIIR